MSHVDAGSNSIHIRTEFYIATHDPKGEPSVRNSGTERIRAGKARASEWRRLWSLRDSNGRIHSFASASRNVRFRVAPAQPNWSGIGAKRLPVRHQAPRTNAGPGGWVPTGINVVLATFIVRSENEALRRKTAELKGMRGRLSRHLRDCCCEGASYSLSRWSGGRRGQQLLRTTNIEFAL